MADIEGALHRCHQPGSGADLAETQAWTPEELAALWLMEQLALNNEPTPADPPDGAGPGLRDEWDYFESFRMLARSALATPVDQIGEFAHLAEELRPRIPAAQRPFADLFQEYLARASQGS